MTERHEPEKPVRDGNAARYSSLVRAVAAVSGSLMIAAALAADLIGLSVQGGFSRNQILMMAAGLLLIAASMLGRRFPRVYNAAGVILLNTLVALLLIEIISLMAMKIWNPREMAVRAIKEQVANLSQEEVSVVLGHYVSYLVWKADPLQQGEESTDERGFRNTSYLSTDPDAYEIFMFGGSAMWGLGVPDSCTIASLLQRRFNESLDIPVRISNYGQISWVSTQELICLMMELRDGARPDLVIFYDGFNDVWSSYQNGTAGEHQNLPQLRSRIEGTEILMIRSNLPKLIFESTNLALLMRLVRTDGTLRQEPVEIATYRTMGVDVHALAESTYAVYSRNMDMAASLGSQYGFDCLFLWQPCIYCGDKTLTPHEQEILECGSEFFRAGGYSAWMELVTLTDDQVEAAVHSRNQHIDLSGVLDYTREECYSDFAGCHLNPFGNAVVADSLACLIRDLGSIHAVMPERAETPL
ncbi:MAG: SGNH/GDSL hydrolase family protein [Candidatus Fermentibacter sp.]|nr:SGNH/GDSL hydrolase family protein [Candidatus Fermentibacter sp.]